LYFLVDVCETLLLEGGFGGLLDLDASESVLAVDDLGVGEFALEVVGAACVYVEVCPSDVVEDVEGVCCCVREAGVAG
jgi:hypothetical protein